jgi:uncharacterized delta-60 repeat protein
MKITSFWMLFIWAFSIADIQHVNAQYSEFLDTSFGINGKFLHYFDPEIFDDNYRLEVVQQSDGKIITVSECKTPSGTPVIGVIRCTPAGELDHSFANNGEWNIQNQVISSLGALRLQPDGKIIIAGRYNNKAGIIRLLPDGTFDPTFGNNGRVEYPIFSLPYYIYVYDLELLSDGRMVVSASLLNNLFNEAVIFCLKPDGSFSPAFGVFSKIFLGPEEFGFSRLTGTTMAITADNKILVCGMLSNIPANWTQGFVRRYNSNGVIDSTFGQNGTTLFEVKGFAGDIKLFPDGRFIIPLTIEVGQEETVAIIQFNENGSINTGYGDNGYAAFPGSGYVAQDAFIQPDEKVVVSDARNWAASNGNQSMAVRFNQNGTVDSTFGLNGAIYSSKYIGVEPNPDAFIIEGGLSLSNEKCILAGRSYWGNILSVVVARFLTGQSVGILEAPSTLQEAFLYPNPVYSPFVNLAYELLEDGEVDIQLFNVAGQFQASLLKSPRTAGKHTEVLALPAGTPSGVYFLNVRCRRGNTFVKFVLKGT